MNFDENSATLDEIVDQRVFFGRLAERGFAPASQEQAIKMAELGAFFLGEADRAEQSQTSQKSAAQTSLIDIGYDFAASQLGAHRQVAGVSDQEAYAFAKAAVENNPAITKAAVGQQAVLAMSKLANDGIAGLIGGEPYGGSDSPSSAGAPPFDPYAAGGPQSFAGDNVPAEALDPATSGPGGGGVTGKILQALQSLPRSAQMALLGGGAGAAGGAALGGKGKRGLGALAGGAAGAAAGGGAGHLMTPGAPIRDLPNPAAASAAVGGLA